MEHPQVRIGAQGLELLRVGAVAGMVDDEIADRDLERRGVVYQVVVVVGQGRPYLHVAELERLHRARISAGMPAAVPCAVVVREVGYDGLLLPAVHRLVEALRVVVAVVVRYQGEVQLGGKQLGAAMVKVDCEERLRGLDDESYPPLPI